MHASVRAESLQLCPTLCDPMGCSLPGSSVHGILEARILEWGATPSSRGSSPPASLMSPALAGGSLPLAPPGKPKQPNALVLLFICLQKQNSAVKEHTHYTF